MPRLTYRNGARIMTVSVYFNLRRKNWSVMERRRVIDHASNLSVRNVTFKVSESARQRVLRTKTKNVHAFICGQRVNVFPYDSLIRISYNPYKAGTFVRCDTGEAIHKADFAFFTSDRKVFAINPR